MNLVYFLEGIYSTKHFASGWTWIGEKMSKKVR